MRITWMYEEGAADGMHMAYGPARLTDLIAFLLVSMPMQSKRYKGCADE